MIFNKYIPVGLILVYLMVNVSGIILYSSDPSGNTTWIRMDQLLENNSISTILINGSFSRFDLRSGNLTNTTCIIFNDGSSICDDTDIDTFWDIVDSKYIANKSDILIINETVLNITINEVLAGSTFVDTDTHLFWDIVDSKYIANKSDILIINETILNISINEVLAGSSFVDTDTFWNITTSKYLINNSDILDLNETILNASIEAITDELDGSDLSFSDKVWIDDGTRIESNISIRGGHVGINGEFWVYDADSDDYLLIRVLANVPTIRAYGAPLNIQSIDDVNDYIQINGDGSQPWIGCVGCTQINFRDKTEGDAWEDIHADAFVEHTENISEEYNKNDFGKIKRDLKAVYSGEHPLALAPKNYKDAIRKQKPLFETEYDDYGSNIGLKSGLNSLAIDYLIDELCKKDKSYGFCINPKVKEIKPKRNKTAKKDE